MVRAFLGNGLVRPFRRDLKSDFASAADLALVLSCVGQILGTLASDGDSVQGELPWRPEFGAKLYKLRHRKGPLRDALAKVFIVDALTLWEPRVIVKEAHVNFDMARRALTVDMVMDVINANVPGNRVIYGDVAQSFELPIAA